jgi:hypothetical protein
MYYGISKRSRSAAAAAAFAVTALLVASLVESFDPVQLERIEAKQAAEQTPATLAWRGGFRRRPDGKRIRLRA